MDNRESGRYDPNINNHPPTCTCAECTKRRLGKKKQAIWSNLGNYLPFKRPETKKPSLSPPKPTIRTTKTLKQALGWLIPAVLIFSCTLIGLGISLFIGTTIPLWLLLGFSLIISIEKWLHHATRKYKYVGKLYRLFLNLSMLCLLGLIIWSGIKLFSQQYFSSSLVGSLVFLAELVFFVWMWKTVSKNSWRWPSMKLTVFLLVCMAVVFTFAGVPPLSTYKDTLITKWEDYQTEQAAQQAEIEAEEAARVEAEQARIEAEEAARVEAEQARIEAEEEDKLKQELEHQRLTSVEHFATLFNEYRRSYGLSTLTFTDDLNKRAALRLPELELDFSHNSLGHYNLHLAENIVGAGYRLDNDDAFLSWSGSPGHNANMLNAGYKYTGYAIGGGYAVQLFTEYPTVNGEPQLPPGWYWDD